MCVVNHLKTFFSKRPVTANEMLTKHLCSISVDVLPSSALQAILALAIRLWS